ncbi:acetylxylan esterase [Cohnella abietis]|uniref:Cephalosporin-C deacetylase n=1 Tax=Cohnella abietis TaxID=2507935 RepID=A0A3T1D1Z2_9BACL|nr:alpha/beta fold hydrolase [Cohnella abietis]BBI32120.1 cephalosporin-C deacetylase [Cohnella abietis]
MSNAISRRIEELSKLAPPLTAQPDLEEYWDQTLKSFSTKPLNAKRTLEETPYTYMDVYKVEYEGFDETPIYGWYLLPRYRRDEKVPCIVHFHGYGGSKGYPEEYASYLLMGFAVFAIDVRGQAGETGNLLAHEYGVAKGWVTQGILHRDTCYYKAITIDALKAFEWVSEQPEVDLTRICSAGGSQGGGIAMIAAALSDIPTIAVCHIPNMCQMDFGVLNSSSSLAEAAIFIERFPEHQDTVFETLSYYDNMNLAHRIRIPVFVTVGLKDPVTMPETIYAAYNFIESEKTIVPYPFSGHTVTGDQHRRAMDFVSEHFGRD